jgi:hypothetical protein
MWSLTFLLVAGCGGHAGSAPNIPEEPPVEPIESDIVARVLPDDADLCAWEATAPELPPLAEPDLAEVPDDALLVEAMEYRPCLDGLLQVGSERGPGAAPPSHWVVGEVFDANTGGFAWMEGTEVDPFTGPGDCGLAVVTGRGSTGASLSIVHGGALTVSGVFGSVVIDPMSSEWHQVADLAGQGIAPAWDTAYDLALEGVPGDDGAPAVELRGLATLPEELFVDGSVALDDGAILPREDLVLTWTGSSEGVIRVSLQGTSFRLVCEAEDDDGGLVVPGELLAEAPAGELELTVARSTKTVLGTIGGRSYLGIGRVVVRASRLQLP